MTACATLDAQNFGGEAASIVTYRVCTWDHETERWEIRDARVKKWEIRRWLRRLYAESWDHVSILVERNA